MDILKITRRLSILVPILGLPAGHALAASPFDGVYAGPVTATRGDCAPVSQMVVTVEQGRLVLAAQPWALIKIRSDGSFSAPLRGSVVAADKRMQVAPNIEGVANGRTLAGRYGTRWCTYSYRLDRTPRS